MDQKINDLYSEYTGGSIDRRGFLKKLSVLAGSIAAASALLPQLERSNAMAEVVAKDDPRLHTEYVEYVGETGGVLASLARPEGDEKLPGVIVITRIEDSTLT